MNDSNNPMEFDNHAQGAKTIGEAIEQNKQDVGVNGTPLELEQQQEERSKTMVEQDAAVPTLDMDGKYAESVRRQHFKQRENSQWVEHKAPDEPEPEKSLAEQYREIVESPSDISEKIEQNKNDMRIDRMTPDQDIER